ncbi:MAG: cell wall hydrolase [Parasphingorhabdus sp.]|nr:cell wall hydrolase [Parasphingorhabdus sp.]
MNRFLKMVGVTSLALTVGAAFAATDASYAEEANSYVAPAQIVIDPAKIEASAAPVIFAPQKEVLQPLPTNIDGAAATQKVDQENASAANKYVAGNAKSLDHLVAMQDIGSDMDAEMKCLASGVYFESKGERLAGQLAVARVIIRRAESGRFPSSLCGVIYQKSQFSFVRGGKMPPIRTDSRSWKNAVAIAKIAVNEGWKSQAEGALFFHATRVSPGWNRQRIATIENHVFYR